MSGAELSQIGYQVLLYPGVLIRAMAAAGSAALGRLAEEAGKEPAPGEVSLADILETELFLQRFQATRPG